MKTKTIFSLLLTIGLFGLINTGIQAQSTTTVEVIEPENREYIELREQVREQAREQAREAVRSSGSVAYSYAYGGQETSSRLSLHKHFNGQTTTKDGTFNVENDVKRIKLNIHGEVESGKIKITLMLPDGAQLKVLSIDDTADMEWSTSFSIEDGVKKYYGTWKYKIETTVADGSYQLSVTTY